MAEVFLAKSSLAKADSGPLALKRIHPSFCGDEHFIAMFQEEARILSTLHHPNICEVYGQGESDGQLFMVMEFIHGKDLHTIYQRGQRCGETMPFSLSAHVLAQIADALDHAHHKRNLAGDLEGIVHRDVSPPNILISYAGTPKLIDFGIARSTRRDVETQPGKIKGKYAYMSPEQAMGNALDGRSDIFSLGIVLYEMLTGAMPFPGENQREVLQRIAHGTYIPVGQACARVPRPLVEVIDRALAKDPDERYSHALDMASALRSYLYVEGMPVAEAQVAAHLDGLFRVDRRHERARIRWLLRHAPHQPAKGRAVAADATRIVPAPSWGGEAVAGRGLPEGEALRTDTTEEPVGFGNSPGPHVLAELAAMASDTGSDIQPVGPLALREANDRGRSRVVSPSPLADGEEPTAPGRVSLLFSPRSRRRPRWLAAAIVAGLAIGVSIGAYHYLAVSKDPGQRAPRRPGVEVATGGALD